MTTTFENPDYYRTVMPYLILENVDAFSEFAQEVFGAEEKMRHTEEDSNQVIHLEITIGDSTIMAGESNKEWKTQPAGLYIIVDSADEMYRKALGAGAESVMELSDQEYGRTGGVKDPFGNTWWITSRK